MLECKWAKAKMEIVETQRDREFQYLQEMQERAILAVFQLPEEMIVPTHFKFPQPSGQ